MKAVQTPDVVKRPEPPGEFGDHNARIEFALTVLSIALGAFSVLTALVAVYISLTPVPYYDTWDYWRTYPDLVAKPLSTLFSQHNEHRIAALRLFLLADHFLFAGRGYSLQICILAVQALSAFLVWKMATRHIPLSRFYSTFLLGVILTMLFSLQQYENFSWPFQIGFVLAYGGTLASFAALRQSSLTTGRASIGWLATSMFAACLATYSLASGLMVWLLLPSLAWFLRLSPKRQAFIGVCSLVVVATYLHSYVRPGHHADPVASLFEPHKTAVFALTYLGAPIDDLVSGIRPVFGYTSEFSRIVWCVGAGVLVTGFSGWQIIRVLTAGRTVAASAALVLAHMMVFLIGSAALTALGRMTFGPSAALVGRYATPALMLWACATALLLPGFQTPGRPRRSVLGQVTFRWIVVIGVFFLFTATQLSRIASARFTEAHFADGRMGMTVGVYHDEAWKKIYHTPGLLIRPMAYMRDNNLAAYSDSWVSFTGRNLGDHFRMPANAAPAGCLGYVDSTTPTQSSFWPGYRLQGWAWDLTHKSVPDGVVFGDATGKMRGFARIVQSRPDVMGSDARITARKTGWIGYATGSRQESLTAYAVLDDNSLCQIGVVSVPSIVPEVTADKVAGAFGTAQAAPTGAWHNASSEVANASLVAVPAVFSSQTPTGNGTGVLEFGPFDTQGASAIAVPLLTGTSTAGLSLVVTDADTGAVLASLQSPPASDTWRLWRADLLGISNLRIKIVAKDASDTPGEHMTIGTPLAVRP